MVLTAHRDAPHLLMARYETHTLPWRVRGAHKELGRSCLLVLDCSGAWRDVGSYVRCAVLPMSVLSATDPGQTRQYTGVLQGPSCYTAQEQPPLSTLTLIGEIPHHHY